MNLKHENAACERSSGTRKPPNHPVWLQTKRPVNLVYGEFVLGSLKDGHDWTLEALKEHAYGIGLKTSRSIGAGAEYHARHPSSPRFGDPIAGSQSGAYAIRESNWL